MTTDSSAEHTASFIKDCQQAFQNGQLQRLVLSKYQGDEPELNRIRVRPINLKNTELLSFLYEYRSRHVTKNMSLADAVSLLHRWLGGDFNNAHMISTDWEIQLRFSKKGKALLNKHRNKNANNQTETQLHNREKRRFVEQSRPYLQALGITDQQAHVIPAMSRKWKQINRFIEVLAGAINATGLADQKQLHIADFGSGKAYLTFALHDYLHDQLHIPAQVTGVELRQELVDLCNKTATNLALDGIKFEQGDVQHFAAQHINVMIALHACDTATDHAIHMGIRSGADIIMCSPCCHKQIRPQLKSPTLLAPLLQHGIHLGQEAEMLTDGLRALLLEAHGYDTKVFEFISLEHTSKNKMILAQKRRQPQDSTEVLQQIAEIKTFYGIQEHCLERLLQESA